MGCPQPESTGPLVRDNNSHRPHTIHFCDITGFCILISFKLPFFATVEIGVSLGYIPSLHRNIFLCILISLSCIDAVVKN